MMPGLKQGPNQVPAFACLLYQLNQEAAHHTVDPSNMECEATTTPAQTWFAQ